MKLSRYPQCGSVVVSSSAYAAPGDASGNWLPWLVLSAIGLVVIGIALRMLFAARFPEGYGAWARRRHDAFKQRNLEWDRADEDLDK